MTSFKSGKAGEAFKIPPGLLTDAQYRCIGAAIVDSELSDEAVAAIEDADTSYAFDDGETRELRNVGTAIQACKDS
ncbi:MAG: hypothetical protein NTV23_05915 [Propionibacteriales bacterium]|nr:hypothetical protein [Propionibacteriales bacterium]